MDRMTERAIRRAVILGVGALSLVCLAAAAQPSGEARYVGSQACRECHPDEYANYSAFAKKARSFDAVKKMQTELTQTEFRGCLKCHTTGYGEPGGFRSEAETPELKNAGCEVCHGPGSRHVESTEAKDIRGTLTRSVCEGCHSQERIEAFQYKPLIYGGAH